ncbi:MAG: PAS domain-containing sensor histidine kinase [Cellvibrionales bacterium TMED122]|nr:MAG: PAS domain-containing sensor histidine kinase [Cellvibrionales bacterium TMED122]
MMAAEHITDLATDHYLEFLATGVVLLDADLHIQALNLSAENLLEVSASRALGSALEELLDESNEWYPLLHQAIAENYPMVRRAIPLTTRTGQERTVDITLSPIAGKLKNGCLLVELNMVDRLQAISRDESEWQAQATLKEIVKGVAHEVKNPLGGIRGAAQLLAGELGNPDLQEYTDIIISEVDRLHTLVDRMMGPRERMESEPTNIHEITEHVRQLIEAEAKGGLEIERDYDPSLPEFSADGGQLTQAVLNLVRNAWQACGEGGRISLRTRVLRQFTVGGSRYKLVCALQVIDDGPGVSEELLPMLFLPMVTGNAKGTGLGLSIAQRIANQHGGLIQVQSEPGNTCFTLLLPMEI